LLSDLKDVSTVVEYYLSFGPGSNERVFFRHFLYTPTVHRQLKCLETCPLTTPDKQEIRRVFLEVLVEGSRLRRIHGDIALPHKIVQDRPMVHIDDICIILGLDKKTILSVVFGMCVERSIIDVRNGLTFAQVSSFVASMEQELWGMGIMMVSPNPVECETNRKMYRNTLIDHVKERRWFVVDNQFEDLRAAIGIIVKNALTTRQFERCGPKARKRRSRPP